MLMKRRQYLTVTAAVTAGLAGCTGFLNDDPDEVVEQFYQALDDGDREAANDLVHSGSPQGEISEDEMSDLEDLDITVEGTEIVEESDDTAEVEAELTIESDGDTSTDTTTVELRTEDGDWKVYE
jgi:ketosteroid isomerase-like protein